jgi:uncharacterized protein (TIGR04255 family)
MRLPVRISPCPIVEAVAEIRFEPTVPPDAVFGQLYNTLRGKFGNLSQLPGKNIPEAMRKANPLFRYQAHYRLEGNGIAVLIGPEVFAVGMLDSSYPGWSALSEAFRGAFALLLDTKVVKTVHRLALRYINFFDRDILHELTLSFTINDKKISGENTFFKTVLPSEGCKLLLQVGKDVALPTKPGILGTLIDIDGYQEFPVLGLDFNASIAAFLEIAHTNEKELFFSLFRQEFLKTLNPVYDQLPTSV